MWLALGAVHGHRYAHSPHLVDRHETERALDLSPDTEVLAQRTVAQGQLFRVLFLCAGQSGHVSGDGSEGVEQGCLHAGFEEQQVHVNLL